MMFVCLCSRVPPILRPKHIRWTLATSLKYCMAGKAPVEALSPHMEAFLQMMHHEDLDVKKAALLMVNAAVHHQVILAILCWVGY